MDARERPGKTIMRVLITQSAQDASVSAAALEARGHRVLAAALVMVERPTPPKLNLSGAQGFLVTSAEGARALADQVGVRTFPVFADSAVTAAALRRLGFKHVETANDDSADLARLVERSITPAGGALIYACSTAAPVSLSAMLGNLGFAVRPWPLYALKRADQLPDDLRAALRDRSLDAALFLSADEARAFVALVQREELEPLVSGLPCIAASPVVAAPLRALKLGGISVPQSADLDSVFGALDGKLVDRVEEGRAAREARVREEAERQRADDERRAHERAEAERQAREQAERERAEQHRQAEEKVARERAARARAEQVRLAREQDVRERAERKRFEKEKDEQERASRRQAEQEHAEREKMERERLANETAERARLERERIAQEKAERERIAAEKAALEKVEKDRLAKERAEQDRLQRERSAIEKAERERIAAEKAALEIAERARLVKERAERETLERARLTQEKAERDRLAREQIAQAKSARERLALEEAERKRQVRERLAIEKAAQDGVAREQAEVERIARAQAALEQAERQRAERERLAQEKAERERIAREKVEAEEAARAQAALEQAERARAERERLAQEKAERERVAREKVEAEKVAREQAAREHAERERVERERMAQEKAERRQIAAERAALERAEGDRLARERAEQMRLDGERLAKERAALDLLAREKAAAEKAEKARIAQARAAEKAEWRRLERERKEQDRAARPPGASWITRLNGWLERRRNLATADEPGPDWLMRPDSDSPESNTKSEVQPSPSPATATIAVARNESSATMAPLAVAPNFKPETLKSDPPTVTTATPPAKEEPHVPENSPPKADDAASVTSAAETPAARGGRAARLLAEDAADLRAKDQRFKYLGLGDTSGPEPEVAERSAASSPAASPTFTAAPDRNEGSRGGLGRVAGLFVVLAALAAAVMGTASWWVPRVTQMVNGASPATPQSARAENATPIQADITALKARVAVLEQAIATTTTSDSLNAIKQELTQRLTALEARAKVGQDGEAVSSLGDSLSSQAKQLAAVSARLATLEAAIGNSARLEDLSKRLNMLEGRSAEANSVLALSDRVTALETSVRRTMTKQSTNIALLTAVAQWREALLAGHPFAVELETAKALAKRADNMVIDTTGFADAAATGIPTLPELQRRFAPAAAAAIRADAIPNDTAAWYRRILDRILSIVTVRRLDGDAAGTSVSAILARTDRRLADGDLAAAVVEMNGLSGNAAGAAQPWLSVAKTRVAAERAAAEATIKAVAAVATSDRPAAQAVPSGNGQ